MLFLNYLIYIFISSFIIFFILAFVQAKKQKLKIKENKALFFDKIKKNKPILKISDDVYYYKGLYLTDTYLFFNGCKIKHYEDPLFIYQVLRTF